MHESLWRMFGRLGPVGLVVMSVLIIGCAPGRPSRIIVADGAGVIRATTHPVDAGATAELEDGTIVTIERSAVEFYGPGVSAERLLLFGDDLDRQWYASLVLDDRSGMDGCYSIDGVAYDEPDSVIVLSSSWAGVGLHLPKRSDFEVVDGLIDDDGLYRAGGEFPEAKFCVDTAGMVFGLA